MADDTRSTLSPAYVSFVGLGERELDVVEWQVHEAMSSMFSLVVRARTQKATHVPSEFLGQGASFRTLHHTGDLVWAGVCSEAGQVSSHAQAGTAMYEFTIVPALWRTTLRRNNRIFQRMTVKDVVSKILGEWKLTSKWDLKEPHLPKDYRVQYHESDYAFMSRLLEEAGISYWFDHTVKAGPGSEVTSIIFSDQPQSRAPVDLKLPYRPGAETFVDGEDVIFDVKIVQQMRFGKSTVRDFDYRLSPDMELLEKAEAEGAIAAELLYEDYRYKPGAFRAHGGSGDMPIADDKGANVTVAQQQKAHTERRVGGHRSMRTAISFSTTAIELTNGDVFAIGQNAGDQVHPNPQAGPKQKLLVVGRHVVGGTDGIAHQEIDAVPADVPHRPVQRAPRPRILGVQSAVVVGPASQEIYVDETGRVRVQFQWDREGGFDEDSSCWIRVSQEWAGNHFGIVALPRVGHEVLVGFFEGDPDEPVVVGRVYNKANGVPFTLPQSKTRSGWRTESSGGSRSKAARGYHELMFEDALGSEQVALRSEGGLSVLVNDTESRDVGGSRSTFIGSADVTHIGKTSLTLVGKKTGFMMSEQDGKPPHIVLSTTGASIQLVDGNILFDANGQIHFHGGDEVQISNDEGLLVIKGAKAEFDKLGATGATPKAGKVPAAHGPSGGPTLHAPPYPSGARAPLPLPKPFNEVKVKDSKVEPAVTAPKASSTSAASTSAASTSASAASAAGAGAPSMSPLTSLASSSLKAMATGASPLDAAKGAVAATATSLGGPVAGKLASVATQLASGAKPLAIVTGMAPGVASELGGSPLLGSATQAGLALAAGSSPLAVVKSMAMPELQAAFMAAELAGVPTQSIAKLDAVSKLVVGFVDLKSKAMLLLGKGG